MDWMAHQPIGQVEDSTLGSDRIGEPDRSYHRVGRRRRGEATCSTSTANSRPGRPAAVSRLFPYRYPERPYSIRSLVCSHSRMDVRSNQMTLRSCDATLSKNFDRRDRRGVNAVRGIRADVHLPRIAAASFETEGQRVLRQVQTVHFSTADLAPKTALIAPDRRGEKEAANLNRHAGRCATEKMLSHP